MRKERWHLYVALCACAVAAAPLRPVHELFAPCWTALPGYKRAILRPALKKHSWLLCTVGCWCPTPICPTPICGFQLNQPTDQLGASAPTQA